MLSRAAKPRSRKANTTGQRTAPYLTTGKVLRVFLAGKTKDAQQIGCAVHVATGRKPGLDIVKCRAVPTQVRLLGQITDGRARLGESLACIRFQHSCGDFQKSGFAGAISPDQTQSLATGYGQFGTFEKRRAAEAEMNIAQGENGRSHGRGVYIDGGRKATRGGGK